MGKLIDENELFFLLHNNDDEFIKKCKPLIKFSAKECILLINSNKICFVEKTELVTQIRHTLYEKTPSIRDNFEPDRNTKLSNYVVKTCKRIGLDYGNIIKQKSVNYDEKVEDQRQESFALLLEQRDEIIKKDLRIFEKSLGKNRHRIKDHLLLKVLCQFLIAESDISNSFIKFDDHETMIYLSKLNSDITRLKKYLLLQPTFRQIEGETRLPDTYRKEANRLRDSIIEQLETKIKDRHYNRSSFCMLCEFYFTYINELKD